MKQRLASPLSILLLFWGCASGEGTFPDTLSNPDGLISPTCRIYAPEVESGVTTRAGEGVKEDDAKVTARLFRADQDPAGVWNTDYSTMKFLSVGVDGSTGKVTYKTDEEWYYLVNGRSSKLLGLYPSTTATVNANNRITYTLDGSTDLMGSAWSNAAHKRSKEEEQPKLTFNHLLTQLIISIYAEDQPAVVKWGNILENGITIDKMTNQCVVELPLSTSTAEPFIHASSSGSVAFTVRDIDGKVIPSQPLILDREYVYGYSMIVPGSKDQPTVYTYAQPLRLTIRTAKHPEGQIIYLPGGSGDADGPHGPPVSTTYTFEAGKAYTIRLKMTAVEIIPTVSIAAWTDPGAHLNGEGNLSDLGDWGNGGSIGNGDVTLRP